MPPSSRQNHARNHARNVDPRLRRLLDALPGPVRRGYAWLQEPGRGVVRVPLALLLVGGGFVGFLPVLGFWMVPLGVLLLAEDVPFLRAPCLRALGAVQGWWDRRRGRAGGESR